MGGSPSRTTTSNTPEIPPEVRALMNLGTEQTRAGLGRAPITDFQDPNIERIAGVNPAIFDALRYYQSLAGGAATPGILEAFNRQQLPLIQQQAGLAGLGRSGALLDAEAIGQAAALMPALQLQSSAAGSMAQLGDYLRQAEQQELSAPYQDFLRRQGITESLLSGATGLIPSSIGARGTSHTSSAGVWGWLLGIDPGKVFLPPLVPAIMALLGGLIC